MVTEDENVFTVRVQPDTAAYLCDLANFKLDDRDLMWFADWLLLGGAAAVKVVRKQHPELTLADLIQLGFFKDSMH